MQQFIFQTSIVKQLELGLPWNLKDCFNSFMIRNAFEGGHHWQSQSIPLIFWWNQILKHNNNLKVSNSCRKDKRNFESWVTHSLRTRDFLSSSRSNSRVNFADMCYSCGSSVDNQGKFKNIKLAPGDAKSHTRTSPGAFPG